MKQRTKPYIEYLWMQFNTLESKKECLPLERYSTPNTFFEDLRSVLSEITEKLHNKLSCWGHNPKLLSGALIYFGNKILQCRNGRHLSDISVLTQDGLARRFNLLTASLGSIYTHKLKPILIRNLIKKTVNEMGDSFLQLPMSVVAEKCQERIGNIREIDITSIETIIKEMFQNEVIERDYNEAEKVVVFNPKITG